MSKKKPRFQVDDKVRLVKAFQCDGDNAELDADIDKELPPCTKAATSPAR